MSNIDEVRCPQTSRIIPTGSSRVSKIIALCNVMERVELPRMVGKSIDIGRPTEQQVPLLLQRLIDDNRPGCPDGRSSTGAADWLPEALIIDRNVIGKPSHIRHLTVSIRVFILHVRTCLPGRSRKALILAHTTPRPPGILAVRSIGIRLRPGNFVASLKARPTNGNGPGSARRKTYLKLPKYPIGKGRAVPTGNKDANPFKRQNF